MAVGIPLILLKSVASLRHLVLDINTLMTVAVAGACALISLIIYIGNDEHALV